MPGFLDNHLRNAFEFALPENRGPKLNGHKFDAIAIDKDADLISNEPYFDAPEFIFDE
jgi:hypothetical protein